MKFIMLELISLLGPALLLTQIFRMVQNVGLVYVCEMAIDIIKHSFIAKFNDIKPIAYSEFLEDLCKQVFSSDFMWTISPAVYD